LGGAAPVSINNVFLGKRLETQGGKKHSKSAHAMGGEKTHAPKSRG